MANGVSRAGWDGPVEIITPGSVDAANDMFTLVALIQDSAPVKSGTLKTDLSARRGNWKLMKSPRRGFRGIIHNSYAFIQDQGGTIPEKFPVSPDRLAMGWGGPVGGPHQNFAKRTDPITVLGQNYIDRGFDRWLKARGHKGPTIAWVQPERLTPQSRQSLTGRGLL